MVGQTLQTVRQVLGIDPAVEAVAVTEGSDVLALEQAFDGPDPADAIRRQIPFVADVSRRGHGCGNEIPPVGGADHRWSTLPLLRSEERRVGKECVSTCRSRGSLSH